MSALTPEQVQALVQTATPGPWAYRPRPHDDWGMVRAQNEHIVAVARDGGLSTHRDEQGHRERGTDPYEANARMICAVHDMADLIATQQATIAAQATELSKLRAQVGAVAGLPEQWRTVARMLRDPVPDAFAERTNGDFHSLGSAGALDSCAKGLAAALAEGEQGTRGES